MIKRFFTKFVKIDPQYKWDNVFKNWLSKICGRQHLKIFTWSILEYISQIIFYNFNNQPRCSEAYSEPCRCSFLWKSYSFLRQCLIFIPPEKVTKRHVFTGYRNGTLAWKALMDFVAAFRMLLCFQSYRSRNKENVNLRCSGFFYVNFECIQQAIYHIDLTDLVFSSEFEPVFVVIGIWTWELWVKVFMHYDCSLPFYQLAFPL